jgi:hypothetical protein
MPEANSIRVASAVGEGCGAAVLVGVELGDGLVGVEVGGIAVGTAVDGRTVARAVGTAVGEAVGTGDMGSGVGLLCRAQAPRSVIRARRRQRPGITWRFILLAPLLLERFGRWRAQAGYGRLVKDDHFLAM